MKREEKIQMVIEYAKKVVQYPKGTSGYDPLDMDNLRYAIKKMEEDTASVISQTKEELLDCIHNLMACLDSPIGRIKLKGDFVDEARNIAREALRSNGRTLTVVD